MQLENPIATTENCRYCLMCRHMCPVGHITHNESLTPHGWGLTIASVKRGLLTWDDETINNLYSCADCGNCQSHCVTDQPLPTAIAAARAELVQQNLAPTAVYTLNEALQKWSNPYEPQKPQPVSGQGEIALFVGDEACYLWPTLLEAALTLLSAVGIEPVLVGVGRNNGYLASSLGLNETAVSLTQATLSELEATGASRLLVLTPGDYYTFAQLLDERLGLALPPQVELMELLPFLAQQLLAERLRFTHAADETATAYIDPTHAVRVNGRHGAPRALLTAVLPAPARELFWREERTHPCGNVGLQFTQPAIAKQLTLSRLQDAAQNGAKRIITEDPGCLAHLQQHAAPFGIEVQGLYELLAQNLETAKS